MYQCESCHLSKDHLIKFAPKPYRPSKPFYLIHSDVWGPSKVTALSCKRWFITFIDVHTRLCWVYLLNKKSDVTSVFKDFFYMIEIQFQTKISILRCDNGTKYFNACLGVFFDNGTKYINQHVVKLPSKMVWLNEKIDIYLR